MPESFLSQLSVGYQLIAVSNETEHFLEKMSRRCGTRAMRHYTLSFIDNAVMRTSTASRESEVTLESVHTVKPLRWTKPHYLGGLARVA
jgi:hypothetical protein